MRQLLETDADALLVLDLDLLVSAELSGDGYFVASRDRRDSVSVQYADLSCHRYSRPARIEKVARRGRHLVAARRRRQGVQRSARRPGMGSALFGISCRSGDRSLRHTRFPRAAFGLFQRSTIPIFVTGDWGVGFSDSDAKNAYRLAEMQLADSQAKFRLLQEQIDALSKRVYRIEPQKLAAPACAGRKTAVQETGPFRA